MDDPNLCPSGRCGCRALTDTMHGGMMRQVIDKTGCDCLCHDAHHRFGRGDRTQALTAAEFAKAVAA